MNLYLDTSALAKLYIREQGSDEVNRWLARADFISTSMITLVEANAAFARAVRMKSITPQTGEDASQLLRKQWPHYLKTPISEKTISRAAELAWMLGLRGYDAIHLASADIWQTALGSPVFLVTYDRQLAAAGMKVGLEILPENMADKG
jgi:predicted nucleic acid-binding protein